MSRDWTCERILEAVRAFQPACVIVAAAELDVFTTLGDKGLTTEALAAAVHADPRATAVLADALVALGLLRKQGPAALPEYALMPQAGCLVDSAGAGVLAGVRHLGNTLRRWSRLAEVVKTGHVPDWPPSIRGQAGDCESFIGAMGSFSSPIAADLIRRIRPLRFRRLLDIGGASGTWTIEFLKAVPDAKAVLFDLPEVIPLARKRLAEAGLSERVTLVAGDFDSDDLPTGADFAWLSAITHQNSRLQNQRLYRKIQTALCPGGRLVIRDVVMNPDRTGPLAGALFAINMLAGTDAGGTFTFDEFHEDLLSAGFTEIEWIHRDEAMNSLIQAVRPH